MSRNGCGTGLLAALLGLSSCVVPVDENENENDIEQGVLAPPSNVTITASSLDRVNLSWDPVAGAIKYYVYQSTSTGGPFTFANTARAPQTSIQIANLTPNTSYCFAVRTEDGTGPGALSTPACMSTMSTPQPPSVVVASPSSATSVSVHWSPVANASKYYVYRSNTTTGTYSYLTTVFAPTLAYQNAGLTAGTTYCYRVAVDVGGVMSGFSSPHCNTSFQPPSGVTAVRTSATRIQVAFGAVTNATKYYVYESVGAGPFAYATTVVQSSAPSVIRANLTTGVQYCYRVQSVNAANQTSPQSLPAVCATP
jgi:fibronectin type 3 domain-containing protein